MKPEYIVGIKDIDDQHEEIDSLTQALCDAIRNRDNGGRLQTLLERFHELLDAHFKVEEAVMATLSYPDTDTHRLAHRAILDRVEGFLVTALQGRELDLAEIEAHQIFIAHVLEHDQPFAAFVRTKHIL